MKEMKLDRKEFNLLVNDILLYVKPVKLRISIANRLIEFFDKKQERIAELEEQLANSIRPKFKMGQEVWYLYQRSIFADEEIKKGRIGAIETFINDIDEKSIKYMIYRFNGDCDLYTTSEHYVFTTKEEALAKLKEMQGE